MTQASSGDRRNDDTATADYRQQARAFMAQSWDYLARGELQQASEKGWGAAAWMTKAVAEANGWEYEHHNQFNVVLRNLRPRMEDNRIYELGGIANGLHQNFYTRKLFLNEEPVRVNLYNMADLLNLLEPHSYIEAQ